MSIKIQVLGREHPDLDLDYNNIGDSLFNLDCYHEAIDAFLNGLKISRRGVFPFKIAKCYEALGIKDQSLSYYIQSAEIRKEDSNCGIEDESTIDSIKNSKRLAKELGKENELPEWMKNQINFK